MEDMSIKEMRELILMKKGCPDDYKQFLEDYVDVAMDLIDVLEKVVNKRTEGMGKLG